MRIVLAILSLSFSLLSLQAKAEQNLWSTAGTLECVMEPGARLTPGVQGGMPCMFRSSRAETGEAYAARVERLGPDMTPAGGKLVWVVLSRLERLPAKSLTGRFTGPREDIMVGEATEAAAALCRGTQRIVCLQPLAGADHEDGDNLAFGISVLRLE